MRTNYCGLITEDYLDKEVTLCGWVHRRRDHGGVIFIDLRDREGLVQVVYQPDGVDLFSIAEQLRHEYVIEIKGQVRYRPKDMVNPNLKTGKIEILGTGLTILNQAAPSPFMLDEYANVSEEVRLRYRYLDLRRPEIARFFILRARVNRILRDYLDEHGFIEIETPMLTKATPEGARDYLVPSRTHPGSFYALPQSPQLFKELLMMSGFDRYYQIVRCFRDEDLRAERQPEFTQLDIEMSFMNEEEIRHLMEDMIRVLFKETLKVDLPDPFPCLTYADAIKRYGSDKPDLRIPLELIDIADLVKDVDFKVFAHPANHPHGRVVVLRLPNGCELSRKALDDYGKFVGIYGAQGLAYIKVNDIEQGMAGLQSPILKFLSQDVIQHILDRAKAKTGDVLFFGADRAKVVNEAMGALRIKLGHDRGLVSDEWQPLWVIDFPMFERDSEDSHWQALHHPFTAPNTEDIPTLNADPGACLSRAYDMVLNGVELGGGSVRIHTAEMQQAIFRILDIDEAQAEEKFGFLLEALKYGCPPLGGLAFGLDRLIMLLCGTSSIRDVIAFPKTQTATCPLTSAPSPVTPEQLKEVGIRLRRTSDKS